MMENKIHGLASVLEEFEGFNKNKYDFLVNNPPPSQWSGILKFLRVFQHLVGEEEYRFETFKVDGVNVDFYYHSDRSVDSFIVKGINREESLFEQGTYLGSVARRIARGNRVAFCHNYNVLDDYYGPWKQVKDYAYVVKANPGNLKEKIESVRKADKELNGFLVEGC